MMRPAVASFGPVCVSSAWAWLLACTEFVLLAVRVLGVPSVIVRLEANVPPPVRPFPATMLELADAAPMSAGAMSSWWAWLVVETLFVESFVMALGVPSVSVRLAVRLPPPVMPLPAMTWRAESAFKSRADCRPITRSISDRAKTRLSLASVKATVSNAVTASIFQPEPHPSTVVPLPLYFACTSDTAMVGYCHDFVTSPSQTQSRPAPSEPNRTGMSEPGVPAMIVAPQRAHALEVCT
ncbi:hypothetical protein D9M68_618690 [compost metagenome]